LFGSAAAITWPFVASSQQPGRVRRIGILVTFPDTDAQAQS
jgi:hypothetical protein